MASCGSLIAYLCHAMEIRGWIPRVAYFPRFEEENLIAYIGFEEPGRKKMARSTREERISASMSQNQSIAMENIHTELMELAAKKDIELVIHNDSKKRQLKTYFEEKCGRMLQNDSFRERLNMYFGSDPAVNESFVGEHTCAGSHSTERKARNSGSSEMSEHSDDVSSINPSVKKNFSKNLALLSDHFFYQDTKADTLGLPDREGGQSRYLILVTGSDNRFAWTRSGEVLADTLIFLEKLESIGLIVLPIISNEECRVWLREVLEIKGYPQFVFKMGSPITRKHIRKRPVEEMLKYGF